MRVLPRSIDIARTTGAPLIAAMLASPPPPRQPYSDDDDSPIVAVSSESIRIEGPSGPTTITVAEAVQLVRKLVRAVNEARQKRDAA